MDNNATKTQTEHPGPRPSPGMLEDGLSMQEAARRLQVSHSVIQRLQERFRATERPAEQPCSGRPRCDSRQDVRFLRISSLHHGSITSTTLRRQLMNTAHVHANASTVGSRLHEARLQSKSAPVSILLTPAHCRARAAWCRRHLPWTRQQMSRILFADESRFNVASNDGRRRVWRRVEERFIRDAVRDADRYGGGSVMVWNGIHLNGKAPLYVVRGSLTGPRYKVEIVHPLHPTCSAGHGTRCHFAGRQRHSSQRSGRHGLPATAGDPQPGCTGPPALLICRPGTFLDDEWLTALPPPSVDANRLTSSLVSCGRSGRTSPNRLQNHRALHASALHHVSCS